jgi:hypothetical protein
MTRGRIVGLWVVLLGLAVAGCAAPQFTYVTNSSQHTYFKVPSGWRQISAGALAAAVNGGSSKPQAGVWTVGYDGSTQPEANHVLGAENQQPFAYSVVAAVNQTTTNELSYNDLRDFFLPVTSAARSSAAKSGFPLTNFKLITDSMLELSQGVHGVREIYDYSYPDGSVNTFDQVALTNADDTEVYLLLVHCLASCYSKHQSEIDTVMKSFTVRSP